MAVFAEKFIALFTLTWIIWELAAHNACNFFNHFLLKFILYFRHFDIKLWNWLWSHDFFDCFIWDDKFHVPLVWISLNVATQPLMSWIFVSSSLRLNLLFLLLWWLKHHLFFFTHHCILVTNWGHGLSSVRFFHLLWLSHLLGLVLHLHLRLHGASTLWWWSILAVTLILDLVLLPIHISLLIELLLAHHFLFKYLF